MHSTVGAHALHACKTGVYLNSNVRRGHACTLCCFMLLNESIRGQGVHNPPLVPSYHPWPRFLLQRGGGQPRFFTSHLASLVALRTSVCAFLPIPLIPRRISKIRCHKAVVILIASYWLRQFWLSDLL